MTFSIFDFGFSIGGTPKTEGSPLSALEKPLDLPILCEPCDPCTLVDDLFARVMGTAKQPKQKSTSAETLSPTNDHSSAERAGEYPPNATQALSTTLPRREYPKTIQNRGNGESRQSSVVDTIEPQANGVLPATSNRPPVEQLTTEVLATGKSSKLEDSWVEDNQRPDNQRPDNQKENIRKSVVSNIEARATEVPSSSGIAMEGGTPSRLEVGQQSKATTNALLPTNALLSTQETPTSDTPELRLSRNTGTLAAVLRSHLSGDATQTTKLQIPGNASSKIAVSQNSIQQETSEGLRTTHSNIPVSEKNLQDHNSQDHSFPQNSFKDNDLQDNKLDSIDDATEHTSGNTIEINTGEINTGEINTGNTILDLAAPQSKSENQKVKIPADALIQALEEHLELEFIRAYGTSAR